MSFSDDVKRFELKATDKIDITARKVAMELFRKVVLKTPVGNPTLWGNNELALLQRETYQAWRESVGKRRASDKTLQKMRGYKVKAPKGYVGGRARGNWQANIGPQSTAVETEVKDKNGGQTINGILGVMSQWKPSDGNPDVIWIGNALPYIIRLEYDAWSTQAPAGMVRVSLSEISVGGAAPSPVSAPGGVLS